MKTSIFPSNSPGTWTLLIKLVSSDGEIDDILYTQFWANLNKNIWAFDQLIHFTIQIQFTWLRRSNLKCMENGKLQQNAILNILEPLKLANILNDTYRIHIHY